MPNIGKFPFFRFNPKYLSEICRFLKKRLHFLMKFLMILKPNASLDTCKIFKIRYNRNFKKFIFV